MLIHEKKPFVRGSLMLISFLAVFVILLSDVMPDPENPGNKITGLQFADDVFNELSKGSSYFIPAVQDAVKPLAGKEVKFDVKMKKADFAPLAAMLATRAGASAAVEDGKLKVSGDLGKLLAAATADADLMYKNDAAALVARYESENAVIKASIDALKQKDGGKGDPTVTEQQEQALAVTSSWWHVLQPAIKELQKQGMIGEAKVIDTVVRRAIEPGHNFFKVKEAKVSEHVFLMAAMLIFYIIYTLWYGFSIFELFEGIGLAMSKSKVKKEG